MHDNINGIVQIRNGIVNLMYKSCLLSYEWENGKACDNKTIAIPTHPAEGEKMNLISESEIKDGKNLTIGNREHESKRENGMLFGHFDESKTVEWVFITKGSCGPSDKETDMMKTETVTINVW